MKKLLPVLAAALVLTGCAGDTDTDTQETFTTTTVSPITTTAAGTEAVMNEEEYFLSYEDRPPLVVKVRGDQTKVKFTNEYNVNILHTDVVGLYGCPVTVQTKDLTQGEIVFEYYDDQLGNTPETNLAMLRYNSLESVYEYTAYVLDTENNTVTAPIHGSSVFMLVDDYLWRSAWGEDTSQLIATEPEETETYPDEGVFCDLETSHGQFAAGITVPSWCYLFDHTENYLTDWYSFATIARIAPEEADRQLWVDISYIIPEEMTDLEGFADLMYEHRAEMLEKWNADYEQITMSGREDIVSADGTPGVRLIADVVYSSKNSDGEKYVLEETRTWYDYYPCDDQGFYELRADYIGSETVSEEDAREVLGSFTIRDGSGQAQ